MMLLDDMPVKPLHKTEYVWHPFIKRRLRIIDSFAPRDLACPICRGGTINSISVVESENPGGLLYHVAFCPACDRSHWFVVAN